MAWIPNLVRAHPNGWNDAVNFPTTPESESQARALLQEQHTEVTNFINNTLLPKLNSQQLPFLDTRNTNHLPFDYQGISCHLKLNSTDGLSDGFSNHAVIHVTDWADETGGHAYQLALTQNNNIWLRTSVNTSTWGAWVRLAKTSDLTQVVSTSSTINPVTIAPGAYYCFSIPLGVAAKTGYTLLLNGSAGATIHFNQTNLFFTAQVTNSDGIARNIWRGTYGTPVGAIGGSGNVSLDDCYINGSSLVIIVTNRGASSVTTTQFTAYTNVIC